MFEVLIFVGIEYIPAKMRTGYAPHTWSQSKWDLRIVDLGLVCWWLRKWTFNWQDKIDGWYLTVWRTDNIGKSWMWIATRNSTLLNRFEQLNILTKRYIELIVDEPITKCLILFSTHPPNFEYDLDRIWWKRREQTGEIRPLRHC